MLIKEEKFYFYKLVLITSKINATLQLAAFRSSLIKSVFSEQQTPLETPKPKQDFAILPL